MIASPRGLLSLSLSLLMATFPAASAHAQGVPADPPRPAEPAGLPPLPLRVVVLEGDNAINSIPLLKSVAPVVEILDENDRVVEGATVEFRLPASGPGGTFPGNRTFFSVRSNTQGQAGAPYIMNTIPGKFEIAVTATLGNREGRAVIRQTNANSMYAGPPVPKTPLLKRRSTWILIAAAAGGGIVALQLLKESGSGDGNVVIRPGGPIVGGPR